MARTRARSPSSIHFSFLVLKSEATYFSNLDAAVSAGLPLEWHRVIRLRRRRLVTRELTVSMVLSLSGLGAVLTVSLVGARK